MSNMYSIKIATMLKAIDAMNVAFMSTMNCFSEWNIGSVWTVLDITYFDLADQIIQVFSRESTHIQRYSSSEDLR